MMTRHFFFIFLPAILLVGLIFFIRVIQYQPLNGNQPTTTPTATDKSTIPIFSEDPVLGQKTAAKTLIIFADFACENCKSEYEVLKTVMNEYPNKVKVVWKGLPVTTIPFNSEPAHKYGFCAHKQNKFEDWADAAFTNSSTLDEHTVASLAAGIGLNQNDLKTCLESTETTDYIQKIKDLAKALGIQTVPTVFFNNVQIEAPQTVEEWKTALSL